MIESTYNNSQYSSNYININQIVKNNNSVHDYQGSQKNTLQFNNDQVHLTFSSETVTTYNSLLSLQQAAEDGYDLLRGLVLNVFKEQGLDYKFETSDSEIDISTIKQEESQELIGDDGYFGVENTSERIVNFAVGMAGGDTTRLDAIREGVEKGFQEALEAFGGWLPDISYDTYDAVMQKLDDWANIKSPEPQT